MLRKWFEFLGLIEARGKRVENIIVPYCGTLDGVLIMRLLSKSDLKRREL